ncbi:MAG: hypothetical protein MUC48_13315 [Leptolyngbya sp. Prado105]|jgi:hypothetical protein|nr:hypothetical protein [Leptolyngbya sp. Prado105]
MSNLSPSNPIQPLSVGDVVSAGVRLYRSNLKRYLILVFRSYLWIFVPVYGWAKASEITARISRLAYQDLINQPESMTEAMKKTEPKVWNFLGAALLMGLIFFGIYIAFIVGLVILGLITVGLASVNQGLGVMGGLMIAIAAIAALVTMIRILSRLFIYDVALAIEDQLDASSCLGRSWNLTKGSVGRIQWIVIVSFVLTLVVNIPSQIIGAAIPVNEDTDPGVTAIAMLLVFAVSLLGSALITPFWQTIKAVIYYDLRARKEGFGLELRDRG